MKKQPRAVTASANAKIEATAKASFEHKKSVTQVIPPDVTRARAVRWLDLISPITEWAGLNGDALRYRRDQLRIQQEAALEILAKSIREKMRGRKIVHPIPPKILVPVIEAASLEDSDSPLVTWWANLLVSGATGSVVRPYLVDLMKAIGPDEAKYLSSIWKKFSAIKEYHSPNMAIAENTAYNLAISVERQFESLRGTDLSKEGADLIHPSLAQILNKLVEETEQKGVQLAIHISLGKLGFLAMSGLYEQQIPREVCMALYLLNERKVSVALDFDKYDLTVLPNVGRVLDVDVVYPSRLGFEFLAACQPIDTVAQGR